MLSIFSQYNEKVENIKFSQKVERLVTQFNSLFIGKLDPNKEALIISDDNDSDMLSKIDYLIKFAHFLSIHSSEIMFRVNFLLDIAPLEDSSAISVSRPGKKVQKKTNENKIPKMTNEESNFVETQYT